MAVFKTLWVEWFNLAEGSLFFADNWGSSPSIRIDGNIKLALHVGSHL
jgi:hypothetical protein